jgi:phosphatidylserine decarboxylase
LMCFMAVGMAEVSTCEPTVAVGQTVKKGDPLGTFHFGGSTHCLIFRPEVKISWDVNINTQVQVKSQIATISSS